MSVINRIPSGNFTYDWDVELDCSSLEVVVLESGSRAINELTFTNYTTGTDNKNIYVTYDPRALNPTNTSIYTFEKEIQEGMVNKLETVCYPSLALSISGFEEWLEIIERCRTINPLFGQCLYLTFKADLLPYPQGYSPPSFIENFGRLAIYGHLAGSDTYYVRFYSNYILRDQIHYNNVKEEISRSYKSSTSFLKYNSTYYTADEFDALWVVFSIPEFSFHISDPTSTKWNLVPYAEKISFGKLSFSCWDS